MKQIVMLLVAFSFVSLFANGEDEKAKEKRVYITKKVNPHSPIVDGLLNDPAWENVEWSSDFTQRRPDDGADPTFETKFKILYDAANLYVAVRAYDSEPAEIERRVSRRDGFEGDWVEINLDSYFDQRTGFSFTISAAGVKGDESISQDGWNWDSNWNPIWYAGVNTDDEGWTAELKIPFSQVRFGEKEEHTWGLQVQRRLYRKEERSLWQHIPQDSPGWVSHFGELRGIKGIKASRRIEILPYSVARTRNQIDEAGNPFMNGQENKLSGGLDAKFGVTSDLTMDVTINPDFGQVEADPSEVNLSAFESFFDEKRPFFIEGKDILNYRLTGGDGSFSNDQLFYSRRIGRSPQYYYDEEDNEYVERPDNTSILGAAKLTGKTRSGISIGVLNAVTQEENVTVSRNGNERDVPVEPQTNYLVSRLQKDFDQGNTIIGGIFTATNRDLKAQHLKNELPGEAYTAGFDIRHQFKEKTYYLDVKGAFSSVRGSQSAIQNLQENSRHYYQRPDADHIELDPTRTELGGWGGTVSFGKAGKGHWLYDLGGTFRSPGFDVNDVGFVRQADISMQYAWLGYRPNRQFWIFREMGLNFNEWTTYDFSGERLSFGGNINSWMQFKNHWQFNYGIARNASSLSKSALRGGPALKMPGEWRYWTHILTDTRKMIHLGAGANADYSDDGFGHSSSYHIDFIYKPSNSMSITFVPFLNANNSNYQYRGTESEGDETQYVLARLKQKTFFFNLRINYSITPDLSIQYYGQPFVSSGKYTDMKYVTSPRANAWEDRTAQYSDEQVAFDAANDEFNIDRDLDGATDFSYGSGFNFREFRSNFVVRWEYSPGSTVYLVWSQSRFGNASHGDFSASNDMENLFDTRPDNIFLMKVNRWFSL